MRLLSDDRCLPQQAPGHQPPNSGMHGRRGCGFSGCPRECAHVCLGHGPLRREGGALFFQHLSSEF